MRAIVGVDAERHARRLVTLAHQRAWAGVVVRAQYLSLALDADTARLAELGMMAGGDGPTVRVLAFELWWDVRRLARAADCCETVGLTRHYPSLFELDDEALPAIALVAALGRRAQFLVAGAGVIRSTLLGLLCRYSAASGR